MSTWQGKSNMAHHHERTSPARDNGQPHTRYSRKDIYQPPPPPPSGRQHKHHHLSTFQQHLVAASGEFVGTFLFLWLAYAGNIMAVNQAPSGPTPGSTSSLTVVVIAAAYSVPLLVNVWAFYRISGGLFNPAVTIGLCASGKLPWVRGAFLVPTQIIASMAAGGLVQAMIPGGVVKANSTISADTSVVQALFIEMFMTAQLVFVVLMLAIEKSKDTFLAPIGIGLALFASMIAGTFYTGGSLNPARSFGCAVASRTFYTYHWVYWVGPVLGGLLAASYYRFVKFAHYEEANPGQDEEVEHDDASGRA